MKNDKSARPTAEVLALWKDYFELCQLDEMNGRQAAIFEVMARPGHYLMSYRLTTWQWLLWPFRCFRIYAGRNSLRRNGIWHDDDSLVQRLEHELNEIEFGSFPLTTGQRSQIRIRIIELNITPNDVRNAFRSCAYMWLHGKSVRHFEQPRKLYWVGRIGRDALAALIGISIAIAVWTGLGDAWQTCTWIGYVLLAEYLTLPLMLLHAIGPAWSKAQQTLQFFPSFNGG
ncbi:MAG: hypothetical protein ACYC4S_06110 [Rhodoferax sp.]